MHRFNIRRVQLLTVALTCLAIGAGASAIATADASNTNAAKTHTRSTAHKAGLVRLRAVARRTVAGSFVVATKSGFVTVTVARGRVQAVSGQTLTLVEGTKAQTYRTVSLSLPATVRVRDNKQPSTLAQVTAGQRATVIIAPDRALVVAHTPPA
jgi:hypothetical protein